MAQLIIPVGSSIAHDSANTGNNFVATSNAVTDLDTAGNDAQIMLVNYGGKAVRVFFTAQNDLVLADTVAVDYSDQSLKHTGSSDTVALERGVVVEAGTTVRATIVVATADSTATDNVVHISAEVLHAPAAAGIDLAVALENTVLNATL